MRQYIKLDQGIFTWRYQSNEKENALFDGIVECLEEKNWINFEKNLSEFLKYKNKSRIKILDMTRRVNKWYMIEVLDCVCNDGKILRS